MQDIENDRKAVSAWRRFLPLAVILAVMALGWALGLHRALTVEALVDSRVALAGKVAAHPVAALAGFVLVYLVLVALSVPGASLMTLAGGLLFGWQLGTVATLLGATSGAILVFLAARTAFADLLRARAGPFLARLADGFRADAFNYLLFLRLVPVFPFWLVNLAPAFLGMRLAPYALATAIGILPGSLALSVIGSGLGGILDAQVRACAGRPDCRPSLEIGDLLGGELLAGLAVLGIVSLIPVVVKAVRARRGAS